MRRIHLIVIAVIVAVVLVVGFFFFKHHNQPSEEVSREQFDIVMAEKMQQLYDQAQDWSKPIELDVHDKRLSGEYQVLSEFLLQYWSNNVETRNLYVRQLKAANWDQFLDVDRLDADRKNSFQQTEKMLAAVHQISQDYQQKNTKNKTQAIEDAEKLNLSAHLKQPLVGKLKQNLKLDRENSLILLELQILKKADAMFAMLKKYPWEKKDGKILFAKTTQVRKFNQLYQDVLKLNVQIDQKKQNNAKELDQSLEKSE